MPQSLILFLTTALLFKKGSGDGTISIFLSYYNNPGGLLHNGHCCDDLFCFNPCDHYFIICLSNLGGSQENTNQCHLGSYDSGTVFNKNEIFFRNTTDRITNPRELRFHRWLGSALLRFVVWDDDPDPNEDEFVEVLTTSVTMNASRSRTEMTYKLFTVKTRTELDFGMAVFCDENWHGPHCDINCNPSFGNYRCGYNGEKFCHSGWTGENCTQNMNGNCVKFNNGYICECKPGYTGLACESRLDACASNPCDNNATCVDEIGQFRCLCPEGYTGPTCSLDVDECASQPCKNNATCINLSGQPQCVCVVGYTGSTCETQTDASSCTTCNNEGTGFLQSPTAKIGITAAMVVVIILIIVTLLIIRKIYRKRKTQQNEQIDEDHRLSHEEVTVYYKAEPVQQRHLTEENIYQNSSGGDTQSTDAILNGNSASGTGPANVYGNYSVIHLHETQANAVNSVSIIDDPVYDNSAASGNTARGVKTKSSDQLDTVEYANAICVKNTGDVYARVNK